jgi:hypothetical protein
MRDWNRNRLQGSRKILARGTGQNKVDRDRGFDLFGAAIQNIRLVAPLLYGFVVLSGFASLLYL